MTGDVRERARRYLAGRRLSGVDVAFIVADEEGATASRSDIAVVTSPVSAPEPPALPRGGPDTGPVAETRAAASAARSPAAAAPAAPAREAASIRFTRERESAAQSSLFGEEPRAERLDLSTHDLGSLEALVASCRRCRLCEGRTRTVFGSGSPEARIVFIGEGPGREEDLQGLPFVGRAGQLLTKMLEAIHFSRDAVYIANMVKCRPPNNREPQEDEMAACEPYLARQLEIIRPAVICALGRTAAHGLLKKGTSLGFLRKAVHYYDDIPVAVTYHPAALLRNPNLKRDAWEDLQAVRRLYDERIREGL